MELIMLAFLMLILAAFVIVIGIGLVVWKNSTKSPIKRPGKNDKNAFEVQAQMQDVARAKREARENATKYGPSCAACNMIK
jgi:hypothetical protein